MRQKFNVDSRDSIGRSWFDLASGSHFVLVQDGSWNMQDRSGRPYPSRYRVFFKAAAGEYTELTKQVLSSHSTKGALDPGQIGNQRYAAVKKEAVEIIERLLEVNAPRREGPTEGLQKGVEQGRAWWRRHRG